MPTYHEIIASIGTGHAFEKHVMDGRKFENTRFGKPIPEVSPNNPQTLANFIQDTLNDPNTRAVYDIKTNQAIIYNADKNVIIHLNASKENIDAGTIFRVEYPDRLRTSTSDHNKQVTKFQDSVDNYTSKMSPDRIHSRNPEDVRAMVNKFGQNHDFHQKALDNIEKPGGKVQRAKAALEIRGPAPEPQHIAALDNHIKASFDAKARPLDVMADMRQTVQSGGRIKTEGNMMSVIPVDPAQPRYEIVTNSKGTSTVNILTQNGVEAVNLSPDQTKNFQGNIVDIRRDIAINDVKGALNGANANNLVRIDEKVLIETADPNINYHLSGNKDGTVKIQIADAQGHISDTVDLGKGKSNSLLKELKKQNFISKFGDEIGKFADEVKNLSKAAKAGRLGANITGIGIAIGGASALLMQKAHAGQRDFAETLAKNNILDAEAYQRYIELNKSTEKLLYGDLALSTADPTGVTIVITAAAENKARGDFKDWADQYAPNLLEEHFQTLAMSMFPDHSARANMLWDARDNLPRSTEGQPEQLHRAIELNALYNDAGSIGYSHKYGGTYGGNLSQVLADAKNMGLEVEGSRDPSILISNLRGSIKEALVQEMDQKLSTPEVVDSILDTIPPADRLDYVRRLVASEDDPEQFAKAHPEIAAYIKEHGDAWIKWGWNLEKDEPLKENPDLLNAYIKERTIPDYQNGALVAGNLSQETKPELPPGVTDVTDKIDTIMPRDGSYIVQSSDNTASLTCSIVPPENIWLVVSDDKPPMCLPEVEQQRTLQQQKQEQWLQDLAKQQANQQAEQQRYLEQRLSNGI
ncbi:MAG: hypothetical protein OEY94_10125 [Alphaproteobacteria bacterium]|nr:hypothetical protein [Alphaproteobacteria bacterium]